MTRQIRAVTLCDRCGRREADAEKLAAWGVIRTAYAGSGEGRDVCPECADEFRDWWHSPPRERVVRAAKQLINAEEVNTDLALHCIQSLPRRGSGGT